MKIAKVSSDYVLESIGDIFPKITGRHNQLKQILNDLDGVYDVFIDATDHPEISYSLEAEYDKPEKHQMILDKIQEFVD